MAAPMTFHTLHFALAPRHTRPARCTHPKGCACSVCGRCVVPTNARARRDTPRACVHACAHTEIAINLIPGEPHSRTDTPDKARPWRERDRRSTVRGRVAAWRHQRRHVQGRGRQRCPF